LKAFLLNDGVDNQVHSIFVVFLLVGSFDGGGDVVGLVFGEDGEVGVEGAEVKAGNLLVEHLGQLVDLVLVFVSVGVFPEFDLGEGLVAEGVAHDE
jgi:hypothetical protein